MTGNITAAGIANKIGNCWPPDVRERIGTKIETATNLNILRRLNAKEKWRNMNSSEVDLKYVFWIMQSTMIGWTLDQVWKQHGVGRGSTLVL